MNKIKILYIITSLNLGGAEQLLLLTLKKLNRNIFTPVVLSLYKDDTMLSAFKETGVKIYCLGYSNKHNPLITAKIAKIIRNENPDIVHTHLPHAAIWGGIAAYIAGVRNLFSTEHNMSIWKKSNHIFYYLYKVTYRLNAMIIAVSKAVKRTMIEEFGIPQGNIIVIYNGIDWQKMIGVKKYPADLKNLTHPIISTIGRLHKTKGHIFIVESFKTVLKIYPTANLLIVGDGNERKNLLDYIKRLKLENKIHMLGSREDIVEILHLIDVFVLPSIEEGLGMVLIESCAAGKPCVASNIGGIPEVIEDEKNGFLVPPSNPVVMAERVIQLLADKNLRIEMGNYGKKIVKEKFSISDKVRTLEQLYLQSISSNKR